MEQPCFRCTLIAAPNDGVAPALLLSIQPPRRTASPVQYLFNVPEGFARLVLEHRVRPGLGLRAAFALGTSHTSLGGLGGLILRLKADGHGKLHLLGPPGTASALAGVAEFVKWRHPEVLVHELNRQYSPAPGSTPYASGAQQGPQGAGPGGAGPTAGRQGASSSAWKMIDSAPGTEQGSSGAHAGGSTGGSYSSTASSCYTDDVLEVCPLWANCLVWDAPEWAKCGTSTAPAAQRAGGLASQSKGQGRDQQGSGSSSSSSESSGSTSSDDTSSCSSSEAVGSAGVTTSEDHSSSPSSPSQPVQPAAEDAAGGKEAAGDQGDTQAQGPEEMEVETATAAASAGTAAGTEPAQTRMQQPQEAGGARPKASSSDEKEDASSSSDGTSEGSTSSGSSDTSGSSDSSSSTSDSRDSSSSSSDSDTGEVEVGKGLAARMQALKQANVGGPKKQGQGVFAQLDALFASPQPGSHSSLLPLGLMQAQHGSGMGRGRGRGGASAKQHEGTIGPGGVYKVHGTGRRASALRDEVLRSLKRAEAQEVQTSHGRPAAAGQAGASNGTHPGACASQSGGAGGRGKSGPAAAAAAAQGMAGTAAAGAAGGAGGVQGGGGSLLGYLCHLKASDQVVLLVCVPSERMLPSAYAHPALRMLAARSAGSRASAPAAVSAAAHPTAAGATLKAPCAVLHLTPPHLANTPAYRRWAKTLPGQQALVREPGPLMGQAVPKSAAAPATATATAVAPGGQQQQPQAELSQSASPGADEDHQQHIPQADAAQAPSTQAADGEGAKHPAPKKGSPSRRGTSSGGSSCDVNSSNSSSSAAVTGLGFLSSARVTARLNLVSPHLFPLPHALHSSLTLTPSDLAAQAEAAAAAAAAAVATSAQGGCGAEEGAVSAGAGQAPGNTAGRDAEGGPQGGLGTKPSKEQEEGREDLGEVGPAKEAGTAEGGQPDPAQDILKAASEPAAQAEAAARPVKPSPAPKLAFLGLLGAVVGLKAAALPASTAAATAVVAAATSGAGAGAGARGALGAAAAPVQVDAAGVPAVGHLAALQAAVLAPPAAPLLEPETAQLSAHAEVQPAAIETTIGAVTASAAAGRQTEAGVSAAGAAAAADGRKDESSKPNQAAQSLASSLQALWAAVPALLQEPLLSRLASDAEGMAAQDGSPGGPLVHAAGGGLGATQQHQYQYQHPAWAPPPHHPPPHHPPPHHPSQTPPAYYPHGPDPYFSHHSHHQPQPAWPGPGAYPPSQYYPPQQPGSYPPPQPVVHGAYPDPHAPPPHAHAYGPPPGVPPPAWPHSPMQAPHPYPPPAQGYGPPHAGTPAPQGSGRIMRAAYANRAAPPPHAPPAAYPPPAAHHYSYPYPHAPPPPHGPPAQPPGYSSYLGAHVTPNCPHPGHYHPGHPPPKPPPYGWPPGHPQPDHDYGHQGQPQPPHHAPEAAGEVGAHGHTTHGQEGPDAKRQRLGSHASTAEDNRRAAQRLREKLRGGGGVDGGATGGDAGTGGACSNPVSAAAAELAAGEEPGPASAAAEEAGASPAAQVEAQAEGKAVGKVEGKAAASPARAPPAAPVPSPAVKALLAGQPACLTAPGVGGTTLVFLGTGSAEPSKYRGASAILLHAPPCGPSPGGGLLMDCGEGTWGALVRSFGLEGAKAQVARLRAVWLSHRHADHVLGLPAILAARPPGAPPLLVVGPAEVGRWLPRLLPPGQAGPCDNSWHQRRAVFVHCRDFRAGGQAPYSPYAQGPGGQPPSPLQAATVGLQGLGLARWQCVAVQHCPDAWGLVVEHAAGWKLVYSGDTRPSPALIAAGRGATLLIHEATFEPDLEDQARTKRHSTSEEALGVAAAMQAYRTVLTHFSQRYPRLPAGLELEGEEEEDENDGEGTGKAAEEDGAQGQAQAQGGLFSDPFSTREGAAAAAKGKGRGGGLGVGRDACCEPDMDAEGQGKGPGGRRGRRRILWVRPPELLLQEQGQEVQERQEQGQGPQGQGQQKQQGQVMQRRREGQEQGLVGQQPAEGGGTVKQGQVGSQQGHGEEALPGPAIAFDGMVLPFSLLPALPLLGPAMALVLGREVAKP